MSETERHTAENDADDCVRLGLLCWQCLPRNLWCAGCVKARCGDDGRPIPPGGDFQPSPAFIPDASREALVETRVTRPIPPGGSDA
jgi:hypothetical protein